MADDIGVPELKKRVLVIEDDDEVREMCQTVLERAGYLVLTASDAETGLQKVRNESPHLVLLDLFLPPRPDEPLGLQVLAAIRDGPSTQDIPVIVLTAPGDDPKLMERGIALGATEYLAKTRAGPGKVAEICQRALA